MPCGLRSSAELVGVDGVHEQSEPVLVLLAADDNWLHVDGEHARADVGVAAARDHDLRLHGAFGILHRRRVVDLERPCRRVDGREGLAGHLVAPHEVDRPPGEVGHCAVLSDSKRNPAAASVGRRGHQHVTKTLVAGIPGELIKSVSLEHETPVPSTVLDR